MARCEDHRRHTSAGVSPGNGKLSSTLIAVGIAFTIFTGFILSGGKASGNYRRSALHPMFLASMFCLICLFDFLYQSVVGGTALRGIAVNLTTTEISQVVLVHLWLFCGLALGGALALKGQRRLMSRLPANMSAAALLCFLLVSTTTLGLYVSSHGLSFGLGQIGAAKSLSANANPVLAQMFWVVVMSAAICITVEKVSIGRIALVLAIATFTVFSSGVRGQLVVLALAALYALSLHGLRIGRVVALMALVPFAFGMALLRVVSRAGHFSGDVEAHIGSRGGLLSFLFETDEVSYVEIFSQFVLNEHLPLWRFPFQGLLSVPFAPLPRDWFAWKPMPLSTDFTLYWSPQIYANSRSELVVGGFSEAILEFGIAFAPLMTGIMGYAAVRLFLRSASAARPTAFFAFAASVGLLFFLRNEFFTMGIIAWSALIAMSGALLAARVLRALGRPALQA